MSVENKPLNICFMGGNQAGLIGALTILAMGHKIICAIAYTENMKELFTNLSVPLAKNIADKKFHEHMRKTDILLSVHGKEIVNKELLRMPKIFSINLHPYLYKYKGADPVGRALQDNEFNASVGAHIMEEKIDSGKVLVEEFIDVSGCKTTAEVYNTLYPLYSIVLIKLIDSIKI